MSVEFYLKKPETKITSLEDVAVNPYCYFLKFEADSPIQLDKYYIEGAIVFKEGDKYIYDWKYYDLIDQLVAYYLHAIHSLYEDKGKIVSFYFPDQPVEVTLKFINSEIYFKLEEDKWRPFPLAEFLNISEMFLVQLNLSISNPTYHELIASISNIRNKI